MKPFKAHTRGRKTACIIACMTVIIAAAAVVWLLLGNGTQIVMNNDTVSELPEYDTNAPLAPIGDSRADKVYTAAIYYTNDAYDRLIPVSRQVTVSSELTLFEAVVDSVLTEPDENSLHTPGNSDIHLLSIEVSRKTATVNLSIDARQLDTQRLHLLRAALTNSLIDTGEVTAVNVLIDGREECVLQLPTGTMSRFDNDFTNVWQQALNEDAQFDGASGDLVLERDVTLYFGDKSGEYLLPEVHHMKIENGDYLSAVLEELMEGPCDTSDCSRLLPTSRQYLRETPEIITSDDGRRIIVISFTGAASEYFNRNGISTALALGSVTRSVCGFVPNVDGVLFDIDGIVVSELYDAQKRLVYTFTDGIMCSGDFDSLVGETAVLYYPAENSSGLLQVEITMSRYDVDNPRALLKQLMEEPDIQGACSAMPGVVTDADVLGIRVEDDQVLINLSSTFYQACQNLSQERARNMVYSIVNTMCAIDDIKSVRFYFDGERVECLASVISMRGPLVYNAGIVRPDK